MHQLNLSDIQSSKSLQDKAQQEVLKRLKEGDMSMGGLLMPFSDLKMVVGFEDYYKDETKYQY